MGFISKLLGRAATEGAAPVNEMLPSLPAAAPAKKRSAKWHTEFWSLMRAHAAVMKKTKAARPVLKSASYHLPKPLPGVAPNGEKLAMDSAISDAYQFAGESEWYGNGFVGYPLLTELVQIPEFRLPCEVLADEMTRKWGKVTYTSDGEKDDDAAKAAAVKIRLIEEAIKDFGVQEHFRWAFEKDGQMGRGNLFLDLGQHDGDELATPFDPELKVKKGGFKGLKRVEPTWMWPQLYEALNPLSEDFYNPAIWLVMTNKVHRTRMLSFVSRPLPDLLKPAYMFGGQSLIQMMWVVVENWMRTRASVSDLVNAFSVMVLATDLSQSISPTDAATALAARVQVFNDLRSNAGTFVVNKGTEELTNVSAPLGGLHELQAQSQEHMAAICLIPLVILFGISPSGLNASSEGEIRVFYARVESLLERVGTPNMKVLLPVLQMHLFGSVDPAIGWQWNPLWALDEKGQAEVRKIDAETDIAYTDAGILDPVEVRRKIAGEEDSPYAGIEAEDVPEPMPNPADEGDPSEEPEEAPDKLPNAKLPGEKV